jgi:hypothetical protein
MASATGAGRSPARARHVAVLLASLCLQIVFATASAAGRPSMRGVIEGYYGPPWSAAARRDAIRFLGAHGLDTFAYGPKNDEYHRARWRDPYPRDERRELARTARAARRAGVRFVYTLSPGLDICYSCPADTRALRRKLRQLARVGVRRFALLLDDTPATLSRPEDVAAYGGSDQTALARAQAALTNATRRWLRSRDLGRLVFMVPTLYAGTTCEPYHEVLAAELARGVAVAWTGPGVIVPRIDAAEARQRRECLGGRGVVLWDNYPVNDTVLTNNLHLGPLTGRPPGLVRELEGYLLNPMTQARASLVALGTAAAYLRHPRRYDPERAWQATLTELGSGPSLAVLAAQTRSSALDLTDAHALAATVSALEASYTGADWTAGVAALETEALAQEEAARRLPVELAGTGLLEEIRPWVAELEAHAGRWVEAVALLRAMKPAVVSVSIEPLGAERVRIAGQVRAVDGEMVAALGESFSSEAASIARQIEVPDVLGYVRCLGDLLGAGIRLCPERGLNVHGKRFYFLLESAARAEVVTGHNVHDRLVRFVAGEYIGWLGRRGGGADALVVRVGDVEVAPSMYGQFVAIAGRSAVASGGLVISTAAGESTAARLALP